MQLLARLEAIHQHTQAASVLAVVQSFVRVVQNELVRMVDVLLVVPTHSAVKMFLFLSQEYFGSLV